MATNTNMVFVDYTTPVPAAWLNYVNNVTNSLAVTNIAALRTLTLPSAGGLSQMIYVQGYYTPGDGGGGLYYVNPNDSTSTDNGGTIILGQAGVRYYLTSQDDYYVEQFGAKGDGATDDAAAIQAAINALPNRGGYVRLKGKTYILGTGLAIGNGNGTSIPSSKNGIHLIGLGGGFGQYNSPTILQVKDNGNTSPYLSALIQVNGPIEGLHLEGFKLYCAGANSSASGSLVNVALSLQGGFTGCSFKKISMVFYSNVGLWIMAGGAPTGNYDIVNEFHQITGISNVNGHVGLLMDGVYAVSNDTWLTTFYTCRFDTFTATNAIAGYFKFVDSITFFRCHFVGNNTGGVGLAGCFGCYFNAVGNPGFPSGLAFHWCSVLTTFVNETTDTMRKCTFEGYGTYDNETIPSSVRLIGYTDQGHPFNGWGT